MQLRQLGNSDLHVSEISFGTWLTTSGGVERDRAVACVHRCFDVGINFIDTANVYGRGASETVLGEALSGIKRDSYVLATKVYFPMSDTDRGLSRDQILKQMDASLLRLKTDHVDLYQCHRFDEETPLEETMQALTDVVRAGKARYIGFSEWPVDQVVEAGQLPGVERFVSSQPQYSMLWRKPEAALIPLCAKSGISQIVWSPLAQGVLTGKYRPDSPPPAGSRAVDDKMNMHFRRQWLERPVLEAVERMKAIAQRADMTLTQFALAWVLREPNVASAIIGASRPEQVDENAAASGRTVPPELFVEAEALLAPFQP